MLGKASAADRSSGRQKVALDFLFLLLTGFISFLGAQFRRYIQLVVFSLLIVSSMILSACMCEVANLYGYLHMRTEVRVPILLLMIQDDTEDENGGRQS